MSSFTCPKCGSKNNRVRNSRPNGGNILRHRQCSTCGTRFVTMERVVGADFDHELLTRLDKASAELMRARAWLVRDSEL